MLHQFIVDFAHLFILALMAALMWTSNVSLRYVDHRYFSLPWFVRYALQGVVIWFFSSSLAKAMQDPGFAKWIVGAMVIGIVAETVHRYYRRHYGARQKLVAQNPFQGYPDKLPGRIPSDQRSEVRYDALQQPGDDEPRRPGSIANILA